MNMRFDERFEWTNKKDVELQKGQKMLNYKRDNLKRVLNTKRQEKLRFQASKDDGEIASISLEMSKRKLQCYLQKTKKQKLIDD